MLVGGVLLSVGGVGSTLALFNGATENAGSQFAGGWVAPPTKFEATPEGNNVVLKWTPGTQEVTGQKLHGVDNGTSSSCTEASTLIATLESATTASYTDENRGTESNDGDWFCYELDSTSSSKWTGQAFKAVQIGLTAGELSTSGTTSGVIEKSGKVVVKFNQRAILPASPISVCVFSTGTILLGDTETEVVSKKTVHVCKAATDPYSVGKLTISGGTISSSAKFEKSKYALSETSRKMTVTLEEAATEHVTVTGSPTWTFIPASTIKSYVETHQATICTAEKSTCRPTTTTDF